MLSANKSIDDYINEHTTDESKALKYIDRLANVRLCRPRMLSGKQQGQFLKMLCQMINAKKVLEIGTFAGYASIAMAEGITSDAQIHTIEIDDEMQDFIEHCLSTSPDGYKVHLHIGSAYDILPSLVSQYKFDLVYIDANKREYWDYYEMIIDNLDSGAIILADNTLWDGKVLEETPKPNDLQTIKIKEFNDKIYLDCRVEQVILPLRDGLTLIRKK